MAEFKNGITGQILLIDDDLADELFDVPDETYLASRAIGVTEMLVELYVAVPGLNDAEVTDTLTALES